MRETRTGRHKCPRCDLYVVAQGHVAMSDCFDALKRQHAALTSKVRKQAQAMSMMERNHKRALMRLKEK